MFTDADVQIIKPDPWGSLTVTCPHCGRGRTFSADQTAKIDKPVQVSCKCGKFFHFRVDRGAPAKAPEPERLEVVDIEPAFTPLDKDADQTLVQDAPLYYADADHKVELSCPKCDHAIHFDASNVKSAGAFSTHCPHCGTGFVFRVELRKKWRKNVDLDGRYTNLATGRSGDMAVKDISFDGVGFETLERHSLTQGDEISVDFHLDDQRRTHLKRKLIVRVVRGHFVGAEFAVRRSHDADLGFYLMQ